MQHIEIISTGRLLLNFLPTEEKRPDIFPNDNVRVFISRNRLNEFLAAYFKYQTNSLADDSNSFALPEEKHEITRLRSIEENWLYRLANAFYVWEDQNKGQVDMQALSSVISDPLYVNNPIVINYQKAVENSINYAAEITARLTDRAGEKLKVLAVLEDLHYFIFSESTAIRDANGKVEKKLSMDEYMESPWVQVQNPVITELVDYVTQYVLVYLAESQKKVKEMRAVYDQTVKGSDSSATANINSEVEEQNKSAEKSAFSSSLDSTQNLLNNLMSDTPTENSNE